MPTSVNSAVRMHTAPIRGYLPARLQPLQTASQLILLSPLLPVCVLDRTVRHILRLYSYAVANNSLAASQHRRLATLVHLYSSSQQTHTDSPDHRVAT